MTGGTGFIGKHLIRRILGSHKRNKVIILDNLYNSNWNDFVKFQANCMTSVESSGFERLDERITFYEVDICDRKKVEAVFEKEKATEVSACIHLAARISVAESKSRSRETEDVNVNGTANILECAKKIDIPCFIFASSAAVYGNPSKLPISEEEAPKPISQYGKSKLNAEKIVGGYSTRNRRAISIRLFNVYGTGQTKEYGGVITKFAERIRRNLPPLIYGNGFQIRDFVHVDDAVNALMKAAGITESRSTVSGDLVDFEMDTANRYSGIYNAGTGVPTKINDLAKMMTDILAPNEDTKCKRQLRPIYLDPVSGDINESYADIEKPKFVLGFFPSISLRHGLENMLSQNNRG